jgi:MFS family permease
VTEGEGQRAGSVWRNRPFLWYWCGGAVTSTGTWIQNVTASVLMYQLTGSSLMVGVLNFANFAPVFALSIVGGVLSDRLDRRFLIVTTHVFSAIVAVGIAALTLTGAITPLLLIVGVALIGSSHAISKPTLSSLLPSLVPRHMIARASAVNVLQFNMGQVLGSTVATVLLATVGAGIAFSINALTFFGPVVAVLVISSRLRPVEKSTRKGFAAAFEGLTYIRGEARMVAMLLCIVLANAGMEALRTLAPATAATQLGATEEAAGLLVGASSLGATVALVSFGFLSLRLAPSRLLLIGFASQVVGVLGIAVSTTMPMGLAFALPVGFGFALLIPILNAGLQELSTDAFRGRVMSSFAMAHLGIRPLFAIVAGGLAAAVSPATAFAALSVGGLLGLRYARRVGATGQAGGSIMPADQDAPR